MDDVNEQTIKLQTDDNVSIAASLIKPSSGNTKRVIVIGSALGVPRYVYFKFAYYVASNGYTVLTFDYRGISQSTDSNMTGSEMKMEHWGRFDIEAALHHAITQLKAEELIYLGHSCGAQLLGLAPSCKKIDRMIFVAGQLGYWKLWPRPLNLGVLLVWQMLWVLTPLCEYLPTKKFGLSSVDMPSGVARQWAQWGKTAGYLFNSAHQLDTSFYKEINVPLLAFHFDDDLWFAPPKSVDPLLEKYSSAKVEKRFIRHKSYNQKKIGHFGFFKERMKDHLWSETLDWMK